VQAVGALCLTAGSNGGGMEADSVVDTIDLTDVAAARAARLWAAAAAAAKICISTGIPTLRYSE